METTKKSGKMGTPFSMDSKIKQVPECSGINSSWSYPDTQEQVYQTQQESVSKAKGQMSDQSYMRN
jgi:hypothetical protein